MKKHILMPPAAIGLLISGAVYATHPAFNNSVLSYRLGVPRVTAARVFTVSSVVGSISANYGNNAPPPKTALGQKLLELRRKAIDNGMKLLSSDEIDKYVDKLRGEEI